MIRNPLRPLGALTSTLALGASLLVMSWASSASAEEPVPPQVYDASEYPPSGTGWRLAAAGAGMTAIWYGGAVGLSYLWPSAPSSEKLMYPVAGPWVALADSGCPSGESDCSLFWVVFRAILTGIDGVGQAGGVVLLAEAALLPTASSGEVARRPIEASPGLTLQATPLLTADSTGLSVFGRF